MKPNLSLTWLEINPLKCLQTLPQLLLNPLTSCQNKSRKSYWRNSNKDYWFLLTEESRVKGQLKQAKFIFHTLFAFKWATHWGWRVGFVTDSVGNYLLLLAIKKSSWLTRVFNPCLHFDSRDLLFFLGLNIRGVNSLEEVKEISFPVSCGSGPFIITMKMKISVRRCRVKANHTDQFIFDGKENRRHIVIVWNKMYD